MKIFSTGPLVLAIAFAFAPVAAAQSPAKSDDKKTVIYSVSADSSLTRLTIYGANFSKVKNLKIFAAGDIPYVQARTARRQQSAGRG